MFLNKNERIFPLKKKPVFIVFILFFGLLFAGSGGFPILNAFAKENSSFISQKEFLSSDFVSYFKKKEYQKALVASDVLLKRYPHDPLILRYRALTLENLGHDKEAVNVYRQILKVHPNYAPSHMGLGLAYAKEGKYGEATNELRWVIQNSTSAEYKHWAQEQFDRLHGGEVHPAKVIEKKPYFLGKIGSAYDSNPLLIPTNSNLLSQRKKDGAFFEFDLDAGYPLILKKDFRLDVVYIGNTIFHDRGTNQVDFTTQGAALDAKKRVFFGDRGVVFGARHECLTNFLRSSIFSILNQSTLSADTSFWKKTRTHLYARLSYADFRQDGSAPDITSRDGIRGGLGIIQYFYSADLKSYIFVKEEGSFTDTRGKDFKREGSLTEVGVHVPLDFLGPVDFDASVGYDWGRYPDFTSLSLLDTNERQDSRLDIYSSFTYHLKHNLALRGFYRFIDSDNQNNFYKHQRHIAGGEVIFSF